MQYSTQRWVKTEDIKSAVERLSCELDDFRRSKQLSINYDITIYDDAEEVGRAKEGFKAYSIGVNLCNRYSRGFLNLDEFCEHMVRVELKRFLYGIVKYLPKKIIEKYQLHQSDNKDNANNVV